MSSGDNPVKAADSRETGEAGPATKAGPKDKSIWRPVVFAVVWVAVAYVLLGAGITITENGKPVGWLAALLIGCGGALLLVNHAPDPPARSVPYRNALKEGAAALTFVVAVLTVAPTEPQWGWAVFTALPLVVAAVMLWREGRKA